MQNPINDAFKVMMNASKSAIWSIPQLYIDAPKNQFCYN